jgi:RNA polymerase sigma factor (sigma-70 family)
MKKPVTYVDLHQDLIDDCLKGSRKAQFKIYKLYYKAMFNTCVRLVNDPMEAEDIMQEAFLAAFSKLADYKRKVSFGAWLKRIVINKTIDYLRTRKNIFDPLDNISEPVYMDQEDEDSLVSSISPEIVLKEIENLPEGYRIVLSLYLTEGYDHEEIAGILNITPSTSRSQYARGKEKLMLNLKKKYLK